MSHVNDPVAVLLNEADNRHHWLGLRLIGTRSHRDAVGAVVRIVTDGGEQLRLVKGGTSYLSSSDPRLFFGLGPTDRVRQVSIRWPSGVVQELRDVEADRYHTILEP